MWFDDPASLTEKYALACGLSLRGVGPYRWDQATRANAGPMFAAGTARKHTCHVQQGWCKKYSG